MSHYSRGFRRIFLILTVCWFAYASLEPFRAQKRRLASMQKLEEHFAEHCRSEEGRAEDCVEMAQLGEKALVIEREKPADSYRIYGWARLFWLSVWPPSVFNVGVLWIWRLLGWVRRGFKPTEETEEMQKRLDKVVR